MIFNGTINSAEDRIGATSASCQEDMDRKSMTVGPFNWPRSEWGK